MPAVAAGIACGAIGMIAGLLFTGSNEMHERWQIVLAALSGACVFAGLGWMAARRATRWFVHGHPRERTVNLASGLIAVAVLVLLFLSFN